MPSSIGREFGPHRKDYSAGFCTLGELSTPCSRGQLLLAQGSIFTKSLCADLNADLGLFLTKTGSFQLVPNPSQKPPLWADKLCSLAFVRFRAPSPGLYVPVCGAEPGAARGPWEGLGSLARGQREGLGPGDLIGLKGAGRAQGPNGHG